MPLLIDGYNLLHVTGIVGRGVGKSSLHNSRLALLNFLAATLDPKQRGRTTVVFDARGALRGLPRVVQHCEMTVRFAAQGQSADGLIEELIQTDSAPRRLTVVSSDRRIQRAARRRRAKVIASGVWYAALIRARQQRRQAEQAPEERPPIPLLAEDVNYWLREFRL